MNSICSSFLLGGLGNILFQISNCYSYSLKNSKQFKLFKCLREDTHHTKLSEFEKTIFKNINFEQCINYSDEYVIYNEENHCFSEIPNFDKNTIFRGYFQSEKYFSNNKKEISELFDLPINKELNSGTCSIHIRRGDYVNLQQFHPLQSFQYYKSAITKIGKNKKYIVFSDDIEWCKSNLEKEINLNIDIEYSNNSNTLQDLIDMSSCENNIIANSTFSWWAAWLNKNKFKNIVAPVNWFGPMYSNKSTVDIYPKEWILT